MVGTTVCFVHDLQSTTWRLASQRQLNPTFTQFAQNSTHYGQSASYSASYLHQLGHVINSNSKNNTLT